MPCFCSYSNNRYIAGFRNTLRVSSYDTGFTERILVGHAHEIICVCAIPGNRLVSGSHYGSLRVWNIETSLCERELIGHTGSVHLVCVLSGGRVFSASRDGTCRVWNPSTGLCERIIEELVYNLCTLADGRIALVCSSTLQLWRI